MYTSGFYNPSITETPVRTNYPPPSGYVFTRGQTTLLLRLYVKYLKESFRIATRGQWVSSPVELLLYRNRKKKGKGEEMGREIKGV